MAQVTPGITAATGTESGPNMICAFQEGDAQYPCDPGCCTVPDGSTTGATVGSDGSTGNGNWFTDTFPIWVIILLIIVGAIMFAMTLAWAAKKMSKNK
jgi:hypothetical protein